MKLNDPHVYAFDVDGTLTEKGQFPDNLTEHKPNPEILKLALFHQKHNTIVVTTARSEEIRKETEEWIKSYGLNPKVILMREKGDDRPDPEVKVEQIAKLKNKYEGKITMYDDKPENCTAVRNQTGASCILVK